MSQDFDNFPIYDDLLKKGTIKMSDNWIHSMSTFIQTLAGYLTQNGMFIPPLTTAQRDALKNVSNGQMIYNTTLNSAQYFKNGVWTSF